MESSQWEKELTNQAKMDVQYQIWLQQLKQLEPNYQLLRTVLSEDQCSLLDNYISICEEMDHTLMRLAYELGFAHGRRTSFKRTQ